MHATVLQASASTPAIGPGAAGMGGTVITTTITTVTISTVRPVVFA